MTKVSRKYCSSIGKSYRKKTSNGRKASCVKKSSSRRRSPKKSGKRSKRRSTRAKRSSARSSSRKNCPKGQVKSYKKLPSGKLSKRAVCVPKKFQGKPKKNPTLEKEAEESLYEPFENPFGTEQPSQEGAFEFNLPALGYRIRRRSGRKSKRHSKRRSGRKSRRHSKRRSHRKY